jgi:hypothetical protein
MLLKDLLAGEYSTVGVRVTADFQPRLMLSADPAQQRRRLRNRPMVYDDLD